MFQKPRNASTRSSGALPAMIAVFSAPIEMPEIQRGFDARFGQPLIDAGLIGAQRAAALQDETDFVVGRQLDAIRLL